MSTGVRINKASPSSAEAPAGYPTPPPPQNSNNRDTASARGTSVSLQHKEASAEERDTAVNKVDFEQQQRRYKFILQHVSNCKKRVSSFLAIFRFLPPLSCVLFCFYITFSMILIHGETAISGCDFNLKLSWPFYCTIYHY